MAATPAPRRLVSIQQIAEYLGVTDLTVRRMIARGDLAAVRIGRGKNAPIRVDMAQVEDELLRPIPTVAK